LGSQALLPEIDKIWWWSLLILTTISWVLFPPYLACAAQKYYYIHVSSFRAKENAVKVARDLQQKGYRSVISGERVQNKGYWYRIYVGPISSLPQAKLQSLELKKRGLTKYTAIYKKSLIRDDSGKTARTAKKAAPVATATAGIKPSQPSKTAPPVGKKPPTIQSSQQRVEAAKKAPLTVSPTEERPKEKYPLPKPDAKISEKPSEETSELQRRGYGRNISAGKLSLSLRQTYREVNTELTERTRIESDGTTTNDPISSSEKNDFDTDMNLSMLRFGLGLTDYLEVFGEIGACYDDFEDFNLAYGGGARLNLFEVKTGSLRGFYSALEADYHKGKLETEYQSIAGNRFSKDADWWDFTGKGEIGFTRNRFAVYVGGIYFVYREDTDRKQLENIPAPLKFEDDLEEENSFGAYGGLSLSLTPGLSVNVEGQVITQSSITGAIEYRF
jgi:hypothetical protein